MASSSQSSQDQAGAQRGGAGQTVVELRDVCGSGLVFWSRQRFDVGAELQLRLRSTLLPSAWRANARGAGWLNLRGLVVLCRSERRGDGSVGFLVSILVPRPLDATEGALELGAKPAETVCFRQMDWLGAPRLGLN